MFFTIGYAVINLWIIHKPSEFALCRQMTDRTPAPAEEADNVVVTEPEEAESSNDSTSESTDEDLSVENPAQTPGSDDDLSVGKEEQSTQTEAGTGNTTTDISPTPAEETTLDENLENDPEVKKAEERGKQEQQQFL